MRSLLRAAAVAALALGFHSRLLAQGAPNVGSETETYLRMLAANGLLAPTAWSSRPFAPAVLDRWLRDSVTPHPWRARIAQRGSSDGLTLLSATANLSYNSALPWGFNDGAVWQGKGMNAWVSGGVAYKRGALSIQLQPVAFVAQNAAFTMLKPKDPIASNPYLNDNTFGIDLPQRFGNSTYMRIDPGQSHLRLDGYGIGVGLSTENLSWGPAVKNNLLFGSNAAGFPHAFIGSSEPLKTPIGRLNAQVVYGRLSQSSWAYEKRGDGTRFGSGLIASWMPPSGRGIELGIARFTHRDWRDVNGSAWTAPFENPFLDKQYFEAGAGDNQLISFFARVTAEEAGLELFGEFGKNDRNMNLRDFAAEPEHNSAISLGLLKTLGDVRGAEFSSVRFEWLSARISSLIRFRGQSTFYDHTPILEGHTQRGQLLGSPLMERTGGFELAYDRYHSAGREGLMLTQRAMPAVEGEGQPSDAARAQWAVEASAVRFRGAFDLSVRGGVLFDLNRTAGNDEVSLFLGFGIGTKAKR